MRLKAIVAALVTAVAAVSGEARACSWAGNTYEREQREPLDALFRRSAFVERIEVRTDARSMCPRWPSSQSAPAEWEQYFASHPSCTPDPMGSSASLTGKVLERFKGQAPDSFGLIPEWGAFSDIRRFSVEDERRFAEGDQARARSSHDWPEFWLQGDVGFFQDQSTSCGGAPFLVDGMSYVVFRTSDEKIIAAEPVGRDDDDFLEWLRGNPGDRATLRRFTPQQAFATATGLALIDVRRCPNRAALRAGELIRARLVRGRPEIIFADPVSVGGERDIFYIDAWPAFHHRTCRPMRLIVVETASAPTDVIGSKVWVPPMPAVVTDGTASVSALFPGVALTGPDRVSVEEAFDWVSRDDEP